MLGARATLGAKRAAFATTELRNAADQNLPPCKVTPSLADSRPYAISGSGSALRPQREERRFRPVATIASELARSGRVGLQRVVAVKRGAITAGAVRMRVVLTQMG